MTSTSTCYSAGKNLCSLGNETTKSGNILIVDHFNLIYAESTNLFTTLAATSAVISFDSFSHCDFLLFLILKRADPCRWGYSGIPLLTHWNKRSLNQNKTGREYLTAHCSCYCYNRCRHCCYSRYYNCYRHYCSYFRRYCCSCCYCSHCLLMNPLIHRNRHYLPVLLLYSVWNRPEQYMNRFL